jgi:hypothetical protein
MTTVFCLKAGARFRSLFIPSKAELSRSIDERQFKGKPMAQHWIPFTVEPVGDRDQRHLPLGNCAMLDGIIPVFSPQSAAALEPLLVSNGELLSVHLQGQQWYAFNATTVIDAIDHKRAVLQYFSGTTRAFMIERYAFHAEAITSAIFKIPQMPVPNYVTDEFKARFHAEALTGLDFKEVWHA